MRPLIAILILLIASDGTLGLCSSGLSQSHSSPVSPNCPDPQNGFTSRMGYADLRWPVGHPYATSYPTSYYYAAYPAGSSGYGSVYSYGYNDVRRTGSAAPFQATASHPYAPVAVSYGNYERVSPFPTSQPTPLAYGRVTPYDRALYGSQPYPISSSQYQTAYPSRTELSPYYYMYSQVPGASPYAPRVDTPDPFVDQYAAQQQHYLFPFGRQLSLKEGKAIMKGHPAGAVNGIIEFCQLGTTGVRIKGTVTGLPAGQGNKGLHILKDKACPPLDQFPIDSKALDHFNPFNSQTHGSRGSAQRHAGDLGNIFVQFDGVTTFDFTTNQLSFDDPANSIANHSVVITEREDDLGSNPQNIESRLRGNAGRAIACGIIQVKDPIRPSLSFMSPSPLAEDQFSRRQDFYAPFTAPSLPYYRY